MNNSRQIRVYGTEEFIPCLRKTDKAIGFYHTGMGKFIAINGKTMTTKEKIAVMQGYLDGKTIQYKPVNSFTNEWVNFNIAQGGMEPAWEWDTMEFRIKPESKLRPYTFAEMCEAVKKHGVLIRFLEGSIYTIKSISFDEIEAGEDELTYEELLETGYVWFDDNSPCGRCVGVSK